MNIPGRMEEFRWAARERAAQAGVPDIEFDREGVDHVINRIKEIIRRRQDSMLRAEDLANIDPMADEDASENFVRVANESGRAYLEFAEKEVKAWREFVAHLEQVRDTYLAHEEQVAGDLDRGVQS